jgi:hypothetical protein
MVHTLDMGKQAPIQYRYSTPCRQSYYLRITLIREAGKPAHFGLKGDKPPCRLLDYVDLPTKATYEVKIPVFASFCLILTKRVGLPSSQP